jgi:UDP-glucose 4-epimerase
MILVTGGAGYIGCHTCVVLLQAGYEVVVLDNLCNSKEESLRRVESITGKTIHFVQADVRNHHSLREVFNTYNIESVIHFAGLKSIGESIGAPLTYYENNVSGSLTLMQVMAEFGVHVLVFSSTAAVYGSSTTSPILENSLTSTANPYGHSKLMVEEVCNNISTIHPCWAIALLRYFNPVGAHVSGLIGEHKNGLPSNLMPNICRVAMREFEQLDVYGNDYQTPDGSAIRDYIHVMDLAEGHLSALSWLKNNTGTHAFNLGTGAGSSVFEMVRAFEAVSGVNIPYRISPRRLGDLPIVYADPSKAQRELGWKANRGIKSMCQDAWNWQKFNPFGYPV